MLERQESGEETSGEVRTSLPARPGRRMPSMIRIARVQQLPAKPHCTRCGRESRQRTRWSEPTFFLERAHIIDRVFGGLDNASNLLPLCRNCHSLQPIFEPGMERAALAWLMPARTEPIWTSPYISSILAGAKIWPPALRNTIINQGESQS